MSFVGGALNEMRGRDSWGNLLGPRVQLYPWPFGLGGLHGLLYFGGETTRYWVHGGNMRRVTDQIEKQDISRGTIQGLARPGERGLGS